MSGSPRWTHARSGHSARRRAHIVGCSAPIGLFLALDRRPGRSSADCCSAVPPTQQRRRDGEAACIANATEERIDSVVFAGPAVLWQPRTYLLATNTTSRSTPSWTPCSWPLGRQCLQASILAAKAGPGAA